MLSEGQLRCGRLLVLVLGLVVLPVTTVAQTDASTTKVDLQRQFNTAYDQKDYAEAIEIGLKVAALDPKDFMPQYRLAAAYALKGDKANALDWFKRCTENGYADIQTAKADPDFESIRADQAFQNALEVIRKNRRAAYEDFKEKAAELEPLVIVPPNYEHATAAPLLVVMHENGGDAEKVAEVFKEPAQRLGAILIAPRAVYPNQGGGHRWGSRYEGDYMVTQTIEYAANHFNIDRRRRVVIGIAEGGTIALVSAYRHAQEFRGVIAVAPQYDSLYAPPPNIMSTRVPRYVLMVGVDDEALADCRKYVKEYRAASLEIELKVYEHLKDGFPENRTAELVKALKYVLSR